MASNKAVNPLLNKPGRGKSRADSASKASDNFDIIIKDNAKNPAFEDEFLTVFTRKE